MQCKKCKEEMWIEEVKENDGQIEVIFHCEDCDLKCQGFYNPEHQPPDPVFWSDEK